MNAEEGRAWLELLAELAPQLRRQGVFEVELGPLKTKIALRGEEVETPVASVRERLEDEEPQEPGGSTDPLDDPDTFDGTNVPGYPALKG